MCRMLGHQLQQMRKTVVRLVKVSICKPFHLVIFIQRRRREGKCFMGQALMWSGLLKEVGFVHGRCD